MKRFWLAAMLLMSLGWTAGRAGAQARVVVALPSVSINQSAFHLAREAGYFRDEGIELITPVIRPNVAIAGLLNGEVDYTLAGDSAAFAAMNGVAVRHIGCINRYQAFQFIVGAKIESAAQQVPPLWRALGQDIIHAGPFMRPGAARHGAACRKRLASNPSDRARNPP